MNSSRSALIVASLLTLTGCDLVTNLVDPKDEREGTEKVGECVERVTKTLNRSERNMVKTLEGRWVPTYTYDVTKMDFEAVQALMVAGSDETAGSRGMNDANETSTAVDRFMQKPVDEKGAFFLGRDPALYRVRGKAGTLKDILKAGCERQQPGMRLIEFDWGKRAPTSEAESNTDTNELDARGEPMEYDLKVNPQDAQTD